MTNRRKYIGPSVDAVMQWWLGSFGHEESQDPEVRDGLMEWWSTDAPEAALEVVHLVVQAISDAGFDIVPRSPVSET